MTNISKKDVFVTLIIAISILLLTFGCVYAVRSQTAYADYNSDYLNNPQAIVNFNQLISNDYVHDSTIPYGQNIHLVNNLTAGNYIFMKIDNVQGSQNFYFEIKDTNDAVLYVVKSHLQNRNDIYLYFQLPTNSNYLNVWTNNNLSINNMWFIDLTQMFGQNSEPDLEECQRIFTADYYQYSLGTPVAYSQMNAFAQGVDSVVSQLDTTIDITTIINNAQPYDNGYRESFIQYYTMTGNYPETRYTQALVFYNACYVPFLTTLDIGTNITISADSIGLPDLGAFRLSISVLGENGQLSLVDTLQDDVGLYNYSYTYSLPFACNGIVIQNLDTTNNYFSFGNLSINYQSTNLGNLIANSYQSGYNNAKSYFDDYYGYNGVGYNDIYNSGYNTGINAQLSEAGRHFYTFPQFLGALFDVPVKTITALLDFEVLGFNLKNFFFSLITLSIVFAIIKFILVRTGDK